MTKQSLSMRSRSGAAILAIAGVALLGACSSGSGNSSSSGGKSPAVTHTASPAASMSVSAATCKHAASLRTSLENLTHLQLNANASAQIRKDLTNVQTQLTAIKTTGNGALSSQLSGLSTSVNKVEKAAKNMSHPPTTSQIQGIISALGGMQSSSQSALAALKSACPNA